MRTLAVLIPLNTPQQRRRLMGWTVIALVAFGLVLRLYELGDRALHHDESLDAWFSQRYVEGTYQGYDPVYHGPLRFYVTAGFYWLFGTGVGSARMISVVSGTLLIGMPWFLRKRLGNAGVLVVALILAISPSFLYFSRFAREDAFFVLLTMVFIVVLFAHIDHPREATLIGLFLALVAMWSVKESVFIVVLVVGSFLLVEFASQLWEQAGRRRMDSYAVVAWGLLGIAAFLFALQGTVTDSMVFHMAWWGGSMLVFVGYAWYLSAKVSKSPATTRLGGSVTKPGVDGWSSAVAIAIFSFMAIFTLFFTEWQGTNTPSTESNSVIDGLVGGWKYWQSQQEVNRGGQPATYYLFIIPAYEYLTIGLALFGARRVWVHSTLFGRFALYTSIISIAAYSYAGERMPWLILHPMLPLLLLAGLGAQDLWDHRHRALAKGSAVVFVAALVLTLAASFQVNYVDPENPREMLTQAGQATDDLADTVDRLYVIDRLFQGEMGRSPKIVIDSELSWPYVFYVRNLNNVLWQSLDTAVPADADVVIVASDNRQGVAEGVPLFKAVEQNHREWWVAGGGGTADYFGGGIAGWWNWMVSRETWANDGGYDGVGGVSETVFVSPQVAEMELRANDLGVGE